MKRKEAPFHDQLIRAVAYAEDLDRLTERVNALEAAAKPQTSTATDDEPPVPRRKGAVIRCRVGDDMTVIYTLLYVGDGCWIPANVTPVHESAITEVLTVEK